MSVEGLSGDYQVAGDGTIQPAGLGLVAVGGVSALGGCPDELPNG